MKRPKLYVDLDCFWRREVGFIRGKRNNMIRDGMPVDEANAWCDEETDRLRIMEIDSARNFPSLAGVAK